MKVIEVLRGDEMKNAVIDFRKTALERHLNAYDEACQKYIEGKIDKISFRDMYRSEIRNLAENEVTSKLILSETSNYQSIKKVYKEWENKS
ncbi:MAG: hypothetical protein FWE33_05180 [Defluviitaleaceae bacterium]|nr:hypothetical protein [Defluviitaleaceae bacterium]